jgi:FAD/FMN-containing dehydrogenase
MNLDALKKTFTGDIQTDAATLETYSHDASLFEVRPQVVVFPRHAQDVCTLVRWANQERAEGRSVSLTPRSAGTCMSGGSLNDSVIMDFTRYMNTIVHVDENQAIMQPGVFYRDLEKETLKRGRIMPTYTASKNICAVGGMFGNNAGGEKSIKYGKMEDFILESKVVFSDGNEYVVKSLTKEELEAKIAQNDFEGNLYKSLYETLEKNYSAVKNAKPKVSKNSAGYYLWNVWDKERGVFDLNKLLVGSQGTLGIVTEMTWRLVPVEPVSNVLAIYMDKLDRIGDLAKTLIAFKPDSIESFDDYSLRLAFTFFFDFLASMGLWQFIRLGISMIPDGIRILRGGIPKLIVLVEIAGLSEREVKEKLQEVQRAVQSYGFDTRIARSSAEAQKYWRIRRESFNLLRKHVKGRRTAPFIDDIIVPTDTLPEFMPKLKAMLDEAHMTYTIAGHVGNGNFHIIPLLDMHNPANKSFVVALSDKVYDLVLSYGGSITAEHNDGIVRTPYLEKMYGPFITGLFKFTKTLFDPDALFNPGKKVGDTKDYLKDHIAIESKAG